MLKKISVIIAFVVVVCFGCKKSKNTNNNSPKYTLDSLVGRYIGMAHYTYYDFDSSRNIIDTTYPAEMYFIGDSNGCHYFSHSPHSLVGDGFLFKYNDTNYSGFADTSNGTVVTISVKFFPSKDSITHDDKLSYNINSYISTETFSGKKVK